MEIKATDVAKLRKMTGAGMMDCKKALVEAEGDFDRAQEIIREKGKLVAAKRADRETTEGAVKARVADGKGILVCLGCETDFVSQNAEFQALANAIADTAIKQKTGARGLRAIVEKMLLDLMYELPSVPGKKSLEITKDFVENKKIPAPESLVVKQTA